MIKIDPAAWQIMTGHALAAFPKECCGIMIGKMDGDSRHVTRAVACINVIGTGAPFASSMSIFVSAGEPIIAARVSITSRCPFSASNRK